MTPPRWLSLVDRLVARHTGARVWVVAVSGGGDSVGLLRALHELAPTRGLTLSVAHLDHGTRGEVGKADAAFVAELAGALGLPVDLGAWTPTRPAHFEADARRARYSWLAETAQRRGAGVVAVGHTSDDQAETVLHRVLRGTGVRGLAGIPKTRVLAEGIRLVRPLRDVSRAEIRAYLDGLGQPCREDASNADPTRTRVRIRHDLLPKLAAEYNPKVAEALVRLARLAAGSNRDIDRRVRALQRSATRAADLDAVSFRRETLIQSPVFVRAEVLRLAWRRAGWPQSGMTEARWNRAARLVRRRRPGRFDLGGGVEARTGAGAFSLRLIATSPAPIAPDAIPLSIPGSAEWPGGRVVVTLNAADGCDETIDLDRVFPPLWVRAPMPGDRFNPLGMGARTTPLNDFFRGRRVAPPERALAPLVGDGLGIIWVVGHRIADRVRLTDPTTRRAGLRWEPSAGAATLPLTIEPTFAYDPPPIATAPSDDPPTTSNRADPGRPERRP